ncbi:MAG TPA: helix-turn-helix transcriptional regulator [Oscillatoriaceae cyanobacterium]
MSDDFEPAIEVEGSLFKFLGFENHEEEDAKSQLLIRIYKVMRGQGWNQSQLAEALKMHKSEVSKLLKGDLDRFSIERMMRMLRDLGTPVRITWVDEPASTRTKASH